MFYPVCSKVALRDSAKAEAWKVSLRGREVTTLRWRFLFSLGGYFVLCVMHTTLADWCSHRAALERASLAMVIGFMLSRTKFMHQNVSAATFELFTSHHEVLAPISYVCEVCLLSTLNVVSMLAYITVFLGLMVVTRWCSNFVLKMLCRSRGPTDIIHTAVFF